MEHVRGSVICAQLAGAIIKNIMKSASIEPDNNINWKDVQHLNFTNTSYLSLSCVHLPVIQFSISQSDDNTGCPWGTHTHQLYYSLKHCSTCRQMYSAYYVELTKLLLIDLLISLQMQRGCALVLILNQRKELKINQVEF